MRKLRIRTGLLLLTFFPILQTAAQSSAYLQPSWQGLKLRLDGHEIFGLGESGHGYESINEAKGKLVDFLREQLNVKAVVFESSFTLNALSYLRKDSLSYRMKYSLYPFWNTASVAAALHAFHEAETKERPLIMGCDIQEDCRFTALSKYLLDKNLVQENKSALLSADSMLSHYIGKDFSRRSALTAEEYQLLSRYYAAIAKELQIRNLPLIHQKLLQRSLQNRQWLCRYLTLTSARERMYFRDSLMAANIMWLKKELYNQDKIVLWAANTHIARESRQAERPQWMGDWLSLHYGEKYFAIAFQKGRYEKKDELSPAFGIRYASEKEKFQAFIHLTTLKKIGAEQWNTPCN